MLTLKDIDLLKTYFMTKDEFNDAMSLQNNNILTFKDEIITEIKDLRLETDVNSSFRSRIDKQDERIAKLESVVYS
jgi:hypothetical protein